MTVIFLYLLFCMLAVMYFDVTRYIIPNWLVGSLLLLYPIAVWLARGPVAWQMSLLAMLIVFAAGYIVFSMKWMGGGDIKLLTACALWVGLHSLGDFIFITALLGGIFAGALWFVRKWLFLVKHNKPWPRLLRNGEPVPYGVAIAVAMIYFLLTGKLSPLA